MIRATAKPAGNHQVRVPNADRQPAGSHPTPISAAAPATCWSSPARRPRRSPTTTGHRRCAKQPDREKADYRPQRHVHRRRRQHVRHGQHEHRQRSRRQPTSTCAPRPPPSSRAVSATNATIAAPISLLETRNVNGESPNENGQGPRRRQRRLVHIPPVKATACGPEVQLIAVETRTRRPTQSARQPGWRRRSPPRGPRRTPSCEPKTRAAWSA